MAEHSSREEIELAGKLKTLRAQEEYEKLLLGATLKKLRIKLGVTQKSIALKLKTSQSVIARMEAGKQNFTIETLIRIASLLGRKLHIKIA